MGEFEIRSIGFRQTPPVGGRSCSFLSVTAFMPHRKQIKRMHSVCDADEYNNELYRKPSHRGNCCMNEALTYDSYVFIIIHKTGNLMLNRPFRHGPF